MANPNEKPTIKTPNEWDKFYENLLLEKKIEVDRIQTESEFLTWASENGAQNPHTLWSARYDALFSSESSQEPQDEKPKEKDNKNHRRQHLEREPTYEEFQDYSKEEAFKKAEEWGKNPNIEIATSKEEAYGKAFAKTHDDFARDYEHLANKWAKEHEDTHLASALARKRADEERKKQEKEMGRIQQAQSLGKRQSRITQLRSRLMSIERSGAQNVSSAGTRTISRYVLRPATNAPRAIIGNAGAKIASGMVKIGARAGMALTRISAIAAASITISASPILIFVGFLILVLFIILVIMMIISPGFFGSGSVKAITSPYPGIGYNVDGPRTAKKGTNFTHRIEVLYDSRTATCSLENITLVDLIPSGTTVVENQTTGIFTTTTEAIKWKLSPENTPRIESSIIKHFHFEIVFNAKDNTTAQNRIYIEGCGDPIIPDIDDLPPGENPIDPGDLMTGADSPPTNDDCGEYGGIMEDISAYGINPSNFGDPLCNYTDGKFEALVRATEKKPENEEFWLKIAEAEGKSPNTFVSQKGTGLGPAFGRFQMGRNSSTRNQGNVTWQKQIQNAIYYNEKWIHGGFYYWGTARCFCALNKYKDKPYCKYIIDHGLERTDCHNSDIK